MIKSLYPQFQRWSATGSIYIISDTHFDDEDCKLMDPYWITPQEHIFRIKEKVHKGDTLIHLGDVGDASYLDELKCYKVLIAGNHDVLSKLKSHFDEIYTGPLFIADRILLSHEPIGGLEGFCVNIHGHDHSYINVRINHINLASNVCHFKIFSLGNMIKEGLLSEVPNYHRITIDKASQKRDSMWDNFKERGIADNIKDYMVPGALITPTLYPSPCDGCSNNPKNGGNGICNCTLGLPKVIC